MTTRREAIRWLALSLVASPVRGQALTRAAKVAFIQWGPQGGFEYRDVLIRLLRERGYVEGSNLTLYWLAAKESQANVEKIVTDLIRDKVDIIVVGTTPSAHAARRVTSTVPIVLANVADPVGSGLVVDLARPGGNITGLSGNLPGLAAKRVEILTEAIPTVKKIAFLGATFDPATKLFVVNTEQAARTLGIGLQVELIGGSREVEAAIAKVAAAGAQALIVQPLFSRSVHRVAHVALQHRLPTVSDHIYFVRDGGLLCYGADRSAIPPILADYIDRILKGAKPGELPIQEPTRFTLGVNLRTAKALGVTLVRSIVDRADEVIA